MKQTSLANVLLAWYQRNKRPLPWRDTRDPYRIWISEIMLQQTQVKTVLPYYHRWMEKFPDLATLARSPLDSVMKLWEGLGYYRRAKNIHETARLIMQEHGGRFPSEAETVYSLPGIGKYTGGAVLSIAFGKRAPILDGNAARILSRLFAITDSMDTGRGQKKLWKLAEDLLPPNNPGDFNQAMMELGAVLCLPQQPACLLCPVTEFCAARKKGHPESFPKKSKKQEIKKIHAACAVLRKNGTVLVLKRPSDGLWADLWEFPTFKITGERSAPAQLTEEFTKLGLECGSFTRKNVIKRTYTNHLEILEVYEGKLRSASGRLQENMRWMRPAALARLAFPSAHAKIIRDHL